MHTVVTALNVLAELERYGIKVEWSGEDEVRVFCPFHERKGDHSPSCYVNVKKKQFVCRAAGCTGQKGGDIISLLAAHSKRQRSEIIWEMGERYGTGDDKIIEPSVIMNAHLDIWSAGVLLEELRKRGVTDDIIRKRKYGVNKDEGRIWIPVPNADGFFVNIRKYKPGAPGKDKMKNVRGFGKPRIYPIDQMKYDTIGFFGGEVKADVAALQLNRHNIGAVCVTAGEGDYKKFVEVLPQFTGKRIVVCLDIDLAGRAGAETKCKQFHNVAESVHGPVLLPLDPNRYPKGDVNDFIAQEHGDLWPLFEEALQTEWQPSQDAKYDAETPQELDLVQAIHADNTGKRVTVKCMVAMMDQAPYVVPRKMIVRCDKNQKMCGACPVYAMPEPTFDISPESPAILQMIAASKKHVREGLHDATGVPKMCPVASFEVSDYYNIEDVRIAPQLEITNRSSDRLMQPAYCIGPGVELNESFEMTGRMYPHPATQQSTMLISQYKATQDALSTYQIRDVDRLMEFRPKEWTVDAIEQKLDAIYSDFEANVTRVKKRREIHLAVDLTYHSPLLITFDGRTVHGWLQTLVMGDSGHGKSEISCGSQGPGGLMAHYRLGEKVECKNASVAGLLGGLAQMGTRWFVSWGIIPTHDRRLVIMEELKGAHPEVFAKLTDMRSSGIAKIDKIEKKQTKARCRLIVNSNTLYGHPVHTYSYGLHSIKELIPGLEDIRRFDLGVLISARDVDLAAINRAREDEPQVAHDYTGELCRQLVLWGWTRPAENVVFEHDAMKQVLKEATRLGEKYTDEIPLLDRGSGRYKIARLAAALACRTFSSDDVSHDTIVVRKCHVDYMCQWVDRLYSSPVFGYAEFTAAQRMNETLIDPDAVKAHISALPFPLDFVKNILRVDRIDLSDLMDWTGWDRIEALELQSFLVRKHALRRDVRVYRKNASFIALLKSMLDAGGLNNRPDFLGESEY